MRFPKDLTLLPDWSPDRAVAEVRSALTERGIRVDAWEQLNGLLAASGARHRVLWADVEGGVKVLVIPGDPATLGDARRRLGGAPEGPVVVVGARRR